MVYLEAGTFWTFYKQAIVFALLLEIYLSDLGGRFLHFYIINVFQIKYLNLKSLVQKFFPVSDNAFAFEF